MAIPALLAVERHIRRYTPAPDGRIFRYHARAEVPPAPSLHRRDDDRGGSTSEKIKAQLGHANISVMMDIYGSLFPSLAQETAAKLERCSKRLGWTLRIVQSLIQKAET